MINYLFVLDINSNEIILDKPKKAKGTYKDIIKTAIQKIKPMGLADQERGKKTLEANNKIYYQKLNAKLLTGAVATQIKKEGDVYRLFADLNNQIKQTKAALKANKELETWLKTEVTKFNKGERLSSAARINERVSSANNMVEGMLAKELEKFEQLEEIDKDVIEMEEMAKSFENNATDLHNEAFWYNRKLQIMIWGGVGLVGVFAGIYIVDIFV